MNENPVRTSVHHRRPPPRPDEVVSLAPRARSSTATLETSSPPEPVSPAAVDSATATGPLEWGISRPNLAVERRLNGEPNPPWQPLAPERIWSDEPEELPYEEMPALDEPDFDDAAYEADARAYEAAFRASQTTLMVRRPASPDELSLIESMSFSFDLRSSKLNIFAPST